MKEFKLSSGRYIRYFDDMVDLATQQHFATFCQNSQYRLDGLSRDNWETQKRYIVSYFSEEELDSSRLFHVSKIQNLLDTHAPNKKRVRQWVIFSDLSTKVYMHYDGGFKVDGSMSFLYYVNNNWDPEWGGETLFANDKGEPEVIIPYTPGRIVLFDSKIPHRSTFVSPDSPWRLTFNAVFN